MCGSVSAVLAMAVSLALIETPQGHAAEATLSSRDGSFTIDGRILARDGESFRIDTKYGVLTIASAGMRCRGLGCPVNPGPPAEVSISGSSDAAGRLIPHLIDSFAGRLGYSVNRHHEDDTHSLLEISDLATDRPALRIRLRAATTEEGFADLMARQADLAVASRPILPRERAFARDAGVGDLSYRARSRILAVDGIVAIVSPDVPIHAISPVDLSLVLAGQIRNWADLGGPDRPISLHLPQPDHGFAQAVDVRLMAPRGRTIAEDAIRHASLSAVAMAVAGDAGALGLTAASLAGDTTQLDLLGTCGATTSASRLALKTDEYPLSAPYFLFATGRQLPGFMRSFLEFVDTPAGQRAIGEAGFIGEGVERAPLDLQGGRLAHAILASGSDGTADLRRLIASLEVAEQLSVSFRFRGGAAELDPHSRSNIRRLAEAIRRGDYSGRTLLFAGFSDGQGAAAPNLRLSRRRAEAVRSAVVAELGSYRGPRLVAEGFGEAWPMACDEDDWGRQINRRVEVWLR